MFLKKGIWSLLIPVALSVIGVLLRSVPIIVIFFFSHFFVVGLAPACKKHESIWMFLLVFFSFIPVNVLIMIIMDKLGMLLHPMFILSLCRCIFYYAMLFSVEEIVMGVITRAIWKKQYKLRLK